MARETIRQTSGAAGELAPRMLARTDWDARPMGLASQLNFISMIEGGWEYRPGFFRQAAAFASESAGETARGRLLAFNRSTFYNFVVELSDLSLRIWNVAGSALEVDGGDAVIELTTPWPSATLGNLMGVRNKDVLIITDVSRAYKPQILAYSGPGSWTLTPFDFRAGPFSPGASGVTLTLSGTTLTASGAVFEAGHVGALIRMRENPSAISTVKWQVDTAVTASDLREYAGRVYQAVSTGDTGATPPIHAEGRRSDGKILWDYVHDGGAILQITAFTSATSVTAVPLTGETMPAAASPTTYWDIQAFNGVDGWPAAAVFHQERIYFAGTKTEPDTAHASQVANYDAAGAGFSPGLASGLVRDDDALRLDMADGTVDQTAWLLSADDLFAGGPSGIKRLRGPGVNEALTANAKIARSVGSFGCARSVPPVRIGQWILFASLTRRILRALSLQGEDDEIARHSYHLLADGIEFMAWELSSNILWIVTRSGRLNALKYDEKEGVQALSPMQIADDGRVESLCVVRRPDGVESVWALINFDVDGTAVRELCILTRRWDLGQSLADACYLDRAGYFDADNPPDSGTVTDPPSDVVGGTGVDPDQELPDDGGISGSGYDPTWREDPVGYDPYAPEYNNP